MLIGGPVAAPFLGMKKEMLQTNRYEAQFPLQWMHKDMQMAIQAAADQDSKLPISEIVRDRFLQARESGLGEQDFGAIYAYTVGDNGS